MSNYSTHFPCPSCGLIKNTYENHHCAPINKNTVYFKCTECGHKYRLNPSVVMGKSAYFGSDADFCPKCDGFPEGQRRPW